MICECKASVHNHESKRRKNYKDYAVDGVLLYSSYLSKEYDVLSIAVSGESKKEIKISHFKGNFLKILESVQEYFRFE